MQWSAHPTWYPKLLSALPDNLILSLEGREVVGSNPTHGALLFFFVAVTPDTTLCVNKGCNL
jgi:hypothetical protein